jgi:hypothetical protein
VLDKYFDKSEYNTGDNTLKGYEFICLHRLYRMYIAFRLTDVNTYVNKEEGHEILQLGERLMRMDFSNILRLGSQQV